MASRRRHCSKCFAERSRHLLGRRSLEARLPRTFTQCANREARKASVRSRPDPATYRNSPKMNDGIWLINSLHDEGVSPTDRLVRPARLLYAQRLCAVMSLKISRGVRGRRQDIDSWAIPPRASGTDRSDRLGPHGNVDTTSSSHAPTSIDWLVPAGYQAPPDGRTNGERRSIGVLEPSVVQMRSRPRSTTSIHRNRETAPD